MRHMGFTSFRKFSLILVFKTCFSPDVSGKNKFKFFCWGEGTSITTITTKKFWWHGGVRKQQIQQGGDALGDGSLEDPQQEC